MFIFLITFMIMKCVTSLPVMLFQLLSTSGDVYIAHCVYHGKVCSLVYGCVTSLPVMLFQLLSTSGDVYISHLIYHSEVCSLVYVCCNFFASDVVSALVDFW